MKASNILILGIVSARKYSDFLGQHLYCEDRWVSGFRTRMKLTGDPGSIFLSKKERNKNVCWLNFLLEFLPKMSDIFLGFQNQVASHYETKVFWYVAITLVEYGTLTYTNYSVDQIPCLFVDFGSGGLWFRLRTVAGGRLRCATLCCMSCFTLKKKVLVFCSNKFAKTRGFWKIMNLFCANHNMLVEGNVLVSFMWMYTYTEVRTQAPCSFAHILVFRCYFGYPWKWTTAMVCIKTATRCCHNSSEFAEYFCWNPTVKLRHWRPLYHGEFP